MARFEILMPKMGESIIEATITKWLKKAGDPIAEDEAIAEIATDKVDSEIPSPVDGVVEKVLFNEGDVVPVGKVIAVINLGGDEETGEKEDKETESKGDKETAGKEDKETVKKGDGRFYSPLVKNIARQENIPLSELDKISGSGKEGRITKDDILNYAQLRKQGTPVPEVSAHPPTIKTPQAVEVPVVTTEAGDEVFEMDRMRRLIADHMVMSKQVSPHVTSFIDVDVSRIVTWREKVKDDILARELEKITYTHILMETCARVLKEFPRVNASVDGYKIIHRRRINIGMATALPNGNLIVPVIKDADQKSLLGIIKNVNDLANRARKNSLLPDEIQGGTFTITNFGTFDSLSGTPVINQPQVAILGTGAIRKKPVVVESEYGDIIAIRHIMILSLAYDHRVVDGALGGMFLKRMKELLENWDMSRKF
ncbi:MAG: dihydrolipoamide acetyltransferase family protein [Bacteroidales bacterium]|jgi:2-oxoglutarate dehydrogenase E2 component (dihydrolipoamide succinyltransferase)|nr:2-oxo acid dehydrogenase subunit E2 [Bacteroidales bacterium]MDX9907784.1 dihydrolipoamide acetyltransferase family protein [Bacteroidales bacterium]